MGETAAAMQSIRTAHDDLMARATRIEDPTYRRRFLDDVPLHARILGLARDWRGHESGRASASNGLASET